MNTINLWKVCKRAFKFIRTEAILREVNILRRVLTSLLALKIAELTLIEPKSI